ncbi:hypothetical protein FRC02_010492 [Tulasnella sp. 418]|nr:hypothetical protein FRC02_010492 [Tulasnella sp. 418]
MGKKSGEVDEEQPPQPIPYVLRQDLLPPPGQEEPATMELSEKRRMLLSREQERIGQNRLPEVGSFPQGPRSEDGNSEEEGAGPSSGGATGSRTKGASSSATATSPVSPSLSGTTSALDQPLSEHDLSRLASKVVSMMASTGSAADSESPPSYQPR